MGSHDKSALVDASGLEQTEDTAGAEDRNRANDRYVMCFLKAKGRI